MLTVASNHVIEELARRQAVENFLGRLERLVCEHRHASILACALDDFDNAVVQPGVIQQAAVIEFEKARQRSVAAFETCGGQCSLHQYPSPLTHHPGDRLHTERPAAE